MIDSSGGGLTVAGDFAKPLNTLIERISDATGVLFEPSRVRRNAKADADAARIAHLSAIELNDMQLRADRRRDKENLIHQRNLESIIAGATVFFRPESPVEKVSDDWILNFVDKAKLISDTEMQNLWSQLMAREANEPGTFSKRAVNLLHEMQTQDAQDFAVLCRFAVNIEDAVGPIVLNPVDQVYRNNNVTAELLHNLSGMNLINVDVAISRDISIQEKVVKLSYCDSSRWLSPPLQERNNSRVLSGGVCTFTPAAAQLNALVAPQKVPGFFEYLLEKWARDGVVFYADGPPKAP